MDRNFKMLLYDYGVVVVRQDANNEVSFNSLDEFKRFADDMITNELDGKTYVCYMPEQEVHTDEAAGTEWSGLVPVFDNIIANYQTLVDRKASRTYGLTGQELIDMQAQIDAEEAERQRLAAINAEISGDGFRKLTPQQIDDHLTNVVYDFTEFDNAPDNAALKAAIRALFVRQKQLDRKIGLRIARLYEE